MTYRDEERDLQRRERENDDWDWYYYEYRYVPYPNRRGNYRTNEYGRDYYGRSGGDSEWEGGEQESQGRDSGYYPFVRSRYGRYSGLGPRGYQRSDERIAEDVNDLMTWHGDLDASDLEVDVEDGVVTLKGTVEDRRQKRLAEDIAESISGVEDVSNQLQIRNRYWNRGESRASNRGSQVRPGMEVIGRDGDPVGEVKEVRSTDFLVDRTMARDIYVPMEAGRTTDGQIRLSVAADEVDDQGWEMPELFGDEEATQRTARNR